MKRMFYKFTLFLSGLIFAINLYAVEIDVPSLSKIPVPKFVQVQIVSDRMNMNGVNMGMLQFKTDEPYSRIIAFYESEVKEVRESGFEQWKIISWVKGKYLYTVQATHDDFSGMTHGFISVSDLPKVTKSKKKVELGKGFPVLRGSEVLNDIYAEDLNKDSRTLWLTNNSSIKQNIQFYRSHYEHRGWTSENVKIASDNRSGALIMTNGPSELNLAVNITPPSLNTNVVAVIVEK